MRLALSVCVLTVVNRAPNEAKPRIQDTSDAICEFAIWTKGLVDRIRTFRIADIRDGELGTIDWV